MRNLIHESLFKGIASLADQGMFSGANFITQVLLARWLLPEAYGAFAVAYTLFLLVSGIFNALILEPMSVLTPTNRKGATLERLRTLPWLYLLLVAISSALLAIAALISFQFWPQRPNLALAMVGAALAAPGTYAYWFARRVTYVLMKPNVAAISSSAYALLLIVGTVSLVRGGHLSVLSVQLLMGLVGFSCGVGVYIAIVPRPLWSPLRSVSYVAQKHWRYGRWVLISSFLFWLSASVYTPLVGAFAGLDAAGGFRAMQNLTLPLTQAVTALSLLAMPMAAARRQEYGIPALRGFAQRVTTLFIIVGTLYTSLLLLGKDALLDWLYGKEIEVYYKLSSLLWPLSIAMLFDVWRQGVSIALAAAQHSEAFFWSRLASLVATLSIGVPLVMLFGVMGAAWGLVSANLIAALVVFMLERRWLR